MGFHLFSKEHLECILFDRRVQCDQCHSCVNRVHLLRIFHVTVFHAPLVYVCVCVCVCVCVYVCERE